MGCSGRSRQAAGPRRCRTLCRTPATAGGVPPSPQARACGSRATSFWPTAHVHLARCPDTGLCGVAGLMARVPRPRLSVLLSFRQSWPGPWPVSSVIGLGCAGPTPVTGPRQGQVLGEEPTLSSDLLPCQLRRDRVGAAAAQVADRGSREAGLSLLCVGAGAAAWASRGGLSRRASDPHPL